MAQLLIDMSDSLKEQFLEYCNDKNLTMRSVITTFIFDLVDTDKQKKGK